MKTKHAGRNGATQTLQRTTQRFPVEGLDCSACGADLRTSLRELSGVQAVNVNVPGKEIAVTYDPTRLDQDAIRVKLETLGLGCS